MLTMEHFYLALDYSLKTTPQARAVQSRQICLRIIMDGKSYCPITFVAQVHQLGDYGDQPGLAYAAGQRLQMPDKTIRRVIDGADNFGAPGVRQRLTAILRPYIKEEL